ncbi:MAG: tetratricopeptide repeat protein [Candidatus Eisenbacteria bacterium]|uniref:Tetratricopeptide repeat protein n=1 Tax=Eiseniibacteriota bacterium TaxID=2212470 RepID=A0A538S7H6_UNCEI|nr:MAG: tetratricopeptide repeat protein [Candidatus Eisenbacteria bacterium]
MRQLRTFGGLSIQDDGASLTGAATQRKTLALLALLATADNHGTSRDKLIACLWPESDTEHGRNLLKQACFGLRRDLHEPELFLGTTELRLNPAAIASDVHAFQEAVERGDLAGAVALYRGPFLDGFYLTGADDFERWVETERARIARVVCEALESLATRAAAHGDDRAAEQWWRRLTQIDPFSSRAALGLMTALVAAGEPVAAIQHARGHEAFLKRELDAAPNEAVLALVKRLCEEARQESLPAGLTGRPRGRQSTADFVLAALPAALRRELRRATTLSIAAATLAVVLVVGAVGYGVSGRTRTGPEPAIGGRKMLVVLPFENHGATADEYFADGLTEAIATRLGSVRSLGVIAWQSASQYKGTRKSPQEIGRELGVQYILQGFIRWEKGAGTSRIRVSPALIRVSDAAQLWADQYDTTLTGVFAVQADLAARVVGALDIALAPPEQRTLAAWPTDNLAAYDAYLRGWELRGRSVDPADLRGAAGLFRQAVTLDSTFALAWADLAAVDLIIYIDYLNPTEGPLAEARAALGRALVLDPDLPRARLSLADYYGWIDHDHERALRELRRVERLRPSYPAASGAIADALRRQGRWEESIRYYHRTIDLNPRGSDQLESLGDLYLVLRRYPEAIAAYDRASEVRPSGAPSLVKALAYLSQTGDLRGTQHLLPDVALNIAPTGLEFVVTTLADVATLLDERQQKAVLRLTPGALDDDTAALALAKAMVYGAGQQLPLARAYFDSARVALEASLAVRGDAYGRLRCMLGVALAGLGRTTEAIRVGKQVVSELPVSKDAMEGPLMLANLARIYVLLDQRDRAVEQLELVLSRPGPLSAGWLRADPFWNSLRARPRFQRLVTVRN